MKGYSLYAVDDLRYEDLNYPDCPPDWAIIQVKYSGICSSDIPRIFTKGTYRFPTIPGHEFSGIVSKVGNKKDSDLIGKKVGVFPLIPCKKCKQCRDMQYEMCAQYDYIGSRRDGAFAEYVAVPIWNVIVLPEEVHLKDAALMEPLAVALHAMKKAEVQTGNSICIIGTGMIAFAAAQWAKILGADDIVVIGRSEKKRLIAEKIDGVRYKVGIEDTEEYDVVLEAVGSNIAIDEAINHTKSGGKTILMGNPEGDICFKQDTYWRILRKQLRLLGTWNSSYENEYSDWIDVKKALASKRLQTEELITHIFEKERLMDGLKLMKDHTEPYCKVMISWGE